MVQEIDADLKAYALWKAKNTRFTRRQAMSEARKLQGYRKEGCHVMIMRQGEHVFYVVGAKKK